MEENDNMTLLPEPQVEALLEKFRSGEDTPYETVRINADGTETVTRRDEEA